MTEYWHIMTDLPHVLSEFTWEISFLVLSVLYTRWRVRREHRAHHDEDNQPIPYVLTPEVELWESGTRLDNTVDRQPH